MSQATFPHRYQVSLASGEGGAGILSAPEHPDLTGGAPVQFGGRPDWWSPEDLLMGAIALCHMTTIQAFARREELVLHALTARAEGVLDKTREGLRFTSIRLVLEVEVDAVEVARAEALLHRAGRHCIIANSLAVPVEHQITVAAR